MTTLIHALSVARYMGIRDEQRLVELSSINLFIDVNNAGKSTILNLISRHVPVNSAGRRDGAAAQPTALEINLKSGNARPRIAVGTPLKTVVGRMSGIPRYDPYRDSQQDMDRVAALLAGDQDHLWFGTDLPSRQGLEVQLPPQDVMLPDHDARQAFLHLGDNVTNVRGGSEESGIQRVVDVVAGRQDLSLPPTSLIPALRRIGPAGEEFGDLRGTGLIDRLAELQSPTHDRLADRDTFQKINAFVRDVTGNADAQIHMPHDRSHVYVEMNGRMLPLENLGTGIQQVIMIAAFCTVREKEVICIEEPELHLRPTLQRKLLDHLRRNTDNQYFIATHSVSFIDTPGASIFHVRLSDGDTVVTSARLDRERHSICMDLGHRASDIVQSNAVLWVEGPSDRIYLTHWIRAVAPELQEGTHYSVMFYGGRLLSHLTADDESLEDLIKLRPLNRHLAIMIDSDRRVAQSHVNASKRRVAGEFAKDGGVAWITAGREVENYVAHATLQAAVREAHPELYAAPANGGGRYEHALHYRRTMPRRGRAAGGDPGLARTPTR